MRRKAAKNDFLLCQNDNNKKILWTKTVTFFHEKWNEQKWILIYERLNVNITNINTYFFFGFNKVEMCKANKSAKQIKGERKRKFRYILLSNWGFLFLFYFFCCFLHRWKHTSSFDVIIIIPILFFFLPKQKRKPFFSPNFRNAK